VSLQVISQP